MRMALVSTVVAAVVAAPLVFAAAGPRMSQDEFLTAVQCTAYSSLPQVEGSSGQVLAERVRLNAEAQDQAPEIATKARAEVRAIYERAEAVDAAQLRAERNAVCGQSGAMIANRTLAPDVG